MNWWVSELKRILFVCTLSCIGLEFILVVKYITHFVGHVHVIVECRLQAQTG